MDRRTFIRSLSLTGAVGALAGCQILSSDRGNPPTVSPGSDTPTPGPTSTPAYGNVVDVVEAGADNSGDEPIDGLLADLANDDTLLYFPPGEYRIGRVALDGYTKLGLVGEDATFVMDRRGATNFLAFRHVQDLRFEGFSADATAPNTGAWIYISCVGGENVVRDYTVNGFCDVDERIHGFTLIVQGGDTSLLLDRVDLSDGALNGIGTFVFPQRGFPDPSAAAGSVTFRDCVMKGWGAEGLYASAHRGPTRVLGGEYANNGISQVRVGGGDNSELAIVRGVTVRVTGILDHIPPSKRVLRGIWLKEGDGAVIEDCDVSINGIERWQTQGGIIVNGQFGRATIRNCRVSTDVSRPAVLIETPVSEFDPVWMPSLDSLPPQWNVTCEDLTVRSSATDSSAVAVQNRANCVFRNLDVRSTGAGTDGIRFRNVTASRVEGGRYAAASFPLVSTTNGECPITLTDAVLETSQADRGTELARADDGQFCIGPSLAEAIGGDVERLGLTQTVERSADETTTSSAPTVLYGRSASG